ncbi:MAG: NAD(P)/FAD-dependent oxidoreductase [Actinomycetota bacterium]
MGRPRVVIVGGGFGGLACARKLDGKPVDVLLVDASNYHLFTPLLYQVATSLLVPSDIAYPFRAVFRGSPNVRFRQATFTGVDHDRKVVVAGGEEITYDYLVLATGSTNDYMGNQAIAEHALGLKRIDEALRLRNHVLACLEHAAQTVDTADRRRWLTFVVVGGGPTGVEYAGALGELLKLVLPKEFPELSPGLARIVLVEGRDRLIAELPEKLGRYARRILERRGVEVVTGGIVEHATPDTVTLSGAEEIAARTLVWCAGVRPVDVAEAGFERSRSGRIVVDGRLAVEGARDVFAIGDGASVEHDGGELPMLSPPAMQEGRYVARTILDEVGGGHASPRPFRYVDKGSMAVIGRSAAVAELGPLKLTGFIGWIVWLTVHIYYLVGFRNRVVVFMSWGWNFIRKDRPIRIIAQARDDSAAAALGGGEEGDGRKPWS